MASRTCCAVDPWRRSDSRRALAALGSRASASTTRCWPTTRWTIWALPAVPYWSTSRATARSCDACTSSSATRSSAQLSLASRTGSSKPTRRRCQVPSPSSSSPRRDGPPRTRAGAALRRRMAGVRARGRADDAYRAGHRRRRARACLPRTARRAHRPGGGLRRDPLSWQRRPGRRCPAEAFPRRRPIAALRYTRRATVPHTPAPPHDAGATREPIGRQSAAATPPFMGKQRSVRRSVRLALKPLARVSASGEWLWAWDPGPQGRSVARFRVDVELAIDRGQAVAEAPQPGSQSDVSAADAVVADFDREPAVAVCDCHRGVRRGGVLGDVGQRLGDDEVGGQLDLLGELSRGHLAHLDRQRSAVSECLDGRPEAAIGEHRRVDPTRQLAYLLERLVELLTRAVQQAPRLPGVRAQLLSGHPERERQRDEPLLGAVVEVTLQPPAFPQAQHAHCLDHRAHPLDAIVC